jgi:hypothetical protein
VRQKVPKVRGVIGLSPAELEALARKYAALAGLRARRDGGGDGATRAELRALAAEFPGCLRELDTLGAREISRRAAACAACAAGGAGVTPEPWMAWIVAYHALMARALAVRSAGAAGAAADDFERAALAPPGGRVNVVVLREIAARFGVAAETVAAALFPVRRASPYRL